MALAVLGGAALSVAVVSAWFGLPAGLGFDAGAWTTQTSMSNLRYVTAGSGAVSSMLSAVTTVPALWPTEAYDPVANSWTAEAS